MKFRPRTTLACLALTAGALATGCASRPTDHIVFVGPTHATYSVASLGAGDDLGRAIYANDVILAANLKKQQGPAFAGAADNEQD